MGFLHITNLLEAESDIDRMANVVRRKYQKADLLDRSDIFLSVIILGAFSKATENDR